MEKHPESLVHQMPRILFWFIWELSALRKYWNCNTKTSSFIPRIILLRILRAVQLHFDPGNCACLQATFESIHVLMSRPVMLLQQFKHGTKLQDILRDHATIFFLESGRNFSGSKMLISYILKTRFFFRFCETSYFARQCEASLRYEKMT